MYSCSTDDEATRVGIVGLGVIAQVAHLPALAGLRERSVVSHLCDVAPGLMRKIQLQGWTDAKTTTNWTDLLTADVDAVVLCTPGSHGRMAGAFVKAGKHVLAEKPLCLSQAEAKHLLSAAEASGVVLQVGYMKAHEPMVRLAADSLASIGDVRHIRITVMHPSDQSQVEHLPLLRAEPVESRDPAAELEHEAKETTQAIGDAPGSVQHLYRDVLVASVIHQLSVIRALIGSVPLVWNNVVAYPFQVAESLPEPPCIQATGQLNDRQSVTLSWNWVPDYPAYREEVEIIGSAGSIDLTLSPPYEHQRPVLTKHVRSASGLQQASTISGPRDAFSHQMASFLHAIKHGGPRVATANDALDDIASLQNLISVVASQVGVALSGEAGS